MGSCGAPAASFERFWSCESRKDGLHGVVDSLPYVEGTGCRFPGPARNDASASGKTSPQADLRGSLPKILVAGSLMVAPPILLPAYHQVGNLSKGVLRPQSGGNRRACRIADRADSGIGCEIRYLKSIQDAFVGEGLAPGGCAGWVK
jgi:hypothetical protein